MKGAHRDRAGPGLDPWGRGVGITASLAGHQSQAALGPHANKPVRGGGWGHSLSLRDRSEPRPRQRGPGPLRLHGDKPAICGECRICTLRPLLALTASSTEPHRHPSPRLGQESRRLGQGAALTQTAPKPLRERGNNDKNPLRAGPDPPANGHASSITVLGSRSRLLR